jgi:hypothetical protein
LLVVFVGYGFWQTSLFEGCMALQINDQQKHGYNRQQKDGLPDE